MKGVSDLLHLHAASIPRLGGRRKTSSGCSGRGATIGGRVGSHEPPPQQGQSQPLAGRSGRGR
ncbi:MAG: hypothetical protein OZSIB_0286 [Candidatus Ozemobacter sibiricus]|uniref:Uncharacterized protein n=1 Tax=Candidatus Ozemobacter sibiricus TaxID=2268124 RepID=A0A367ZP56_9BACT|nr:MAG: hypothetical protein OZSIB_0286 [Candidatus Ozemobacter sibiricus]